MGARDAMSSRKSGPGLVQRAAEWLGRPRARAITWQPQPDWPGDAAAARRLASGVLLLRGTLVEAPGVSPWDVTPPNPAWEAALHGHGWLDDFAASKSAEVRAALRGWVFDWIDRYADSGRGPGWAPELVARRVMRWIGHAPQLLSGVQPEDSEKFFTTLGRHAHHLGSVWNRTPPGIARVEALAGLVYAGLSLEGYERLAEKTIETCFNEIDALVAEDGGIPSRNPEELARLLELALWTWRTVNESAFGDAHRDDRRIPGALERLVPVLRAVRHPDGQLARFHGATPVAPERLNALIAETGVRTAAPAGGAMGYRRVASGPIHLVADCAPQPPGGSASALAMEVAIGARPVIVNCGSGTAFGEDQAAWSQTAPAHSGIGLVEEPEVSAGGAVRASLSRDTTGTWLLGESDRLRAETGLVLERRIFVAQDGKRLAGEETVLSPSASDRTRFAKALADRPGCQMAVRFHLHPSVRAASALGGKAAVLTLPDGARWMFRQFGGALEIAESRYFAPGHLAPRPTRQLLLTTPLTENWGRVTWSLEPMEEGAIPGAPKAAPR